MRSLDDEDTENAGDTTNSMMGHETDGGNTTTGGTAGERSDEIDGVMGMRRDMAAMGMQKFHHKEGASSSHASSKKYYNGNRGDINNNSYHAPQGSMLSTFSSSGSSGTFSPMNETANHVSVVTEDHGFQHQQSSSSSSKSQQGGSFVEEYLYDNDPVGLEQWQQSQDEKQPLSPKEENNGSKDPNNNTGWCATWSDNGLADDSSLRLVKNTNNQKHLSLWTPKWSPPTTAKRTAERVRNFFPSTPTPSVNNKRGAVDPTGLRLDVNYGIKKNSSNCSSTQEDEYNEGQDEEQGGGTRVGLCKPNLPCHERMRTRRCKVLVLAIVIVVIGTMVAAIGLALMPQGEEKVIESPAMDVGDDEVEEKKGAEIDSSGSNPVPSGPSSPVPDTMTSTEITEKENGGNSATHSSSDASVEHIQPATDASFDASVGKTETATTGGSSETSVEKTETVTTGGSGQASVDKTEAVTEDTAVNNVAETSNKQPPPPKNEPAASAVVDPSKPTCIHLKIVMSTNDGNDANHWSLSRTNENGKVIDLASGEAFPEEGNTHTFKKCVLPGVYTFTINDSGGDGLGSNGSGGYYITANDVTLGVSSFFFHEERMTFALPFDGGEGEEEDGGSSMAQPCSDDFVLAIKTDKYPNQTTWDVIDNDSGDEVLKGGPYDLPYTVYTRRACLPHGNYTFHMKDDGGDGVCCDDGKGFFVLSKDGETIVDSDGKFGKGMSKVFLLGGDDDV